MGRPLMFMFWTLVLWGTVYAATLVYEALISSPADVWRRATGGHDSHGSVVNLGLAALAVVVWTLLALALRAHAKGKRDR